MVRRSVTFIWTAVFCTSLYLFPTSARAAATLGNVEQPNSIKDISATLNLDKQRQADLERQAARFVRRDPFVPQKIDYGFELGQMWHHNSLYVLGGNLGYHLGECMFADTSTCQQYVDFLVESAGRDGYTYTNLMPSLRWQYINFPSTWSLLGRVFAGYRHAMTPDGSTQIGIAGVGFGVTTYLHPRADVRVEARLAVSDQVMGQIIVSIQMKADRWVDFFARKLKDVGVGTVDATGSVLKTTVDVTGKVMEGTAGAAAGAAAGAVRAIKKDDKK